MNWFLFVCFNSNEMFWQLIYFSLSTSQQYLIFVNMFRFWRNVYRNSCFAIYDHVYMLKYNEMLCFVCNLRMSRNVFRFLFTCSDFDEMFMTFISQFSIAFCMLKSCSIFDESFHFWFDQHMFWNAFIKMFDQKFVSHERRFFYKIRRNV